MKNKTKFKLNDAGITFLATHIAMGGMYFLHNAKKFEDDTDLGELMSDMSEHLAKSHAEDGHFFLEDSEYLLVLLAVNTARHAIINGSKRQLIDMTNHSFAPPSFGKSLGEGKGAVKTSVLLVDYLELNAPEKVKEEWLQDKKKIFLIIK